MKQIKRFDLVSSIKEYFHMHAFMPIIPWIQQNISLADDVSSEHDHPDFTQYPYQVEILQQWEDLDSRKHVIVMCCEQLGKTSLAVYGILYRLAYKPRKHLMLLSK